MVAHNDNSCPLCAQGKGCSRLFQLFGKQAVPAVDGDARLAIWVYGIPLGSSLLLALLGAFLGEWQSIAGFAIGLLAGFFLLRLRARNLS
jgi:hypothetical protein